MVYWPKQHSRRGKVTPALETPAGLWWNIGSTLLCRKKKALLPPSYPACFLISLPISSSDAQSSAAWEGDTKNGELSFVVSPRTWNAAALALVNCIHPRVIWKKNIRLPILHYRLQSAADAELHTR
jgi:hypothetical protein